MGCILGVLVFIWKIIKLAVKTIVKIVIFAVKTLVKVGLALPLLAAIALLVLWLTGFIVQGTPLFDACWIGLIVLTILNIILNIFLSSKKSKKKKK